MCTMLVPMASRVREAPHGTESKQSDPEFLFVIDFVLCVVGYFSFLLNKKAARFRRLRPP